MITSRSNKKLKEIRSLRNEHGDHLVLEGPHLVGEAQSAGIPMETVLVTPGFLASTEGSALCRRLDTVPLEVAPDLLASLADADAPRGILAVGRRRLLDCASLPAVEGGYYLYLDGVQDPGNLGTLARLAEAAGANAMFCSQGCAHPHHPRALRASAGSLLRLPVARNVETGAVDHHLAAIRPRWIALDAHGAKELWSQELVGALVLVLGAEGRGLSPAVAKRADLDLYIPLQPPVESLNVASAAAVVLFELRRRHW